MTSVLDGIRVLDLSSGPAGGLATMVLADFGAEVIKVEGPRGDPFRAKAAAPMWLRGKQSIVLDLTTNGDQAKLASLTAGADAVVASYLAEDAKAFGADYETLARANPALIYCSVTAFGTMGPYARYPAYESVAASKMGRMQTFRLIARREGPGMAALQVGTHSCAQSAASGILAALHQRDETGNGRYMEATLMQGIMAYDQGAGLISAQIRNRNPERFPDLPWDLLESLPQLNYHPYQTGDGKWIQIGALLPNLWMSFVEAIGLTDALDPDIHQGMPGAWPEEVREDFRDQIFRRMQEKPADEWMKIFVDHGGVVGHKFQTSQQAMDDPDIVANGHVIERHGIRQLGPIGRLTVTPAKIEGPAPEIGEHTDQVLGALAESAAAAAAPSAPTDAPLKGVTVLEFATVIAAPLGTSYLADLGAHVIKIEPIGGDPYRNMGMGIGAMRVNNGVESISIDMKSPEGQELGRRMLKDADIVIQNFRIGVAERLGFGWEDAKKINPKLIYLIANGYGPDGPGSHRPSTHPVPGAAIGGAVFQNGGLPAEEVTESLAELRENARRLMRCNDVNPDPNTGAIVCTAALLGLRAARHQGVGQVIYTDMFGANAYANFDDFVSYEGKPERAYPDSDLYGMGPLNRVYETAEGWVTFDIQLDQEWATFCELSGFDGADDDADAIATLFGTDTAMNWEAKLAAQGVACIRCDAPDTGQFFLEDPQVEAFGLLFPIEHKRWGDYRRHGPMAKLRGVDYSYLAGPPIAGQHNWQILKAYGFSDSEIADFTQKNLLYTEPLPAEAAE